MLPTEISQNADDSVPCHRFSPAVSRCLRVEREQRNLRGGGKSNPWMGVGGKKSGRKRNQQNPPPGVEDPVAGSSSNLDRGFVLGLSRLPLPPRFWRCRGWRLGRCFRRPRMVRRMPVELRALWGCPCGLSGLMGGEMSFSLDLLRGQFLVDCSFWCEVRVGSGNNLRVGTHSDVLECKAGWTDHLQMSPVEGCPTVFEVICWVTPGIHQYTFYVDGEWRHDERQPFVTGNYGTVNTMFVSLDSDNVPSVQVPDTTTSTMNMDVDSEMVQRTDEGHGTRNVHIDVSRDRISVFLSTHTAYDLLPDSGKVVALDVDLSVKQAFHILYEQGFPVAPLWDSHRGQFIGMLSALDFILILRELGNHASNLTEEVLETHTISAWKEGKQQLRRQVDGHARPFGRNLIYAGPNDSLKDIALKILQNEVATVPIIHSSAEESFSQLLHLSSLSGILECICRHFGHSSSSLPILQHPISDFRLGTWVPKIGETNGRPLVMLRPNASLSSALSLLVEARVSSIPIVDDNDSLLDVYCRSDITALAKDRAYAQFHLDEMSIHQALQLGQDASSPFGFFNGQRCQMCLQSDPLQKVMERLANPGVRRVIIVEAGSRRVEGIISLSDIFRFLLG